MYARTVAHHRRAPSLALDRAFLHGLRSGRLRLTSLPVKLRGSSFARIRQRLAELDLRQLSSIDKARQLQTAEQPCAVERLPHAELWLSTADARHLPAHGEAALLENAGRDRFGRTHWLQPAALRALRRLHHAAALDGVELELISSFRSARDQLRILLRKHASGQSWEQILKVNAPPGFSEHHSGCAVDLAVPGAPPLTEAFESTLAYGWLQQNAGRFGFELSYPRGNRWGFIHEPWHWCYRG